MTLDPSLAAAAAAAPPTYGHWGVNALVVLVTFVTVCLCVLLHYEALTVLSRKLALRRGPHRGRVVLAIFGLLGVHIAEIWIFGVACGLLLLSPLAGAAHGLDGGALDFIYLSAMLFTTVGASDAFVTGPVRFLTGTEALTGLVLITWSASFTFIEMQRFWRDR